MKILVVYDGTIHSKQALRYGIKKVQETGGEVIALQVFHAGQFLDYEGGISAVDAAKRESEQYLAEAKQIIEETGAAGRVKLLSESGEPVGEALHVAAKEQADQIIAPARYRALAKTAPCPVLTIPGALLLPVDNSAKELASLDEVVREAKALSSTVVLLGIVPVHLYSRWERKEVGKVKRSTAAALKKARAALKALGVETAETVRSGYPDEEILKAAEEYAVSLIMIPAGGATPSELSKAAHMLLEEPERMRRPVLVLSAAGAA